MTEHGYQNIDKILEGLFSYLLLVHKSGTDEILLKDLQKKCKIDFKFRVEESSLINVESAVTNILTLEHKDILTADHVVSEIDIEFIGTLINVINERKFNLTILTPDYKIFNKKHELSGLKYAEVGK